MGPVGKAGYQTIQSALTAANTAGGGQVFVQPGTYTESLTLYNNTQVVGATGLGDTGSVIIIGVHTPPSSGSFVFRNCFLESSTHIFSSSAAGTSALVCIDCLFNLTNGYVFNCPNWTSSGSFTLFDIGDISTTNGVVNNTGGASILFDAVTVGAGTSNSFISSGTLTFALTQLNCPVSMETGTVFNVDDSIFTKTTTLANNSTGEFTGCRFTTGASVAITMSSSAAVNISNSVINSSHNPAVSGSGAGTLTINEVTLTNNTSLANTLTIATTGGLYPSGNLGSSGYVWTSNGAGEVPTFQAAAGGTYYSVTPYIVGQSGDAHAQFTGTNAIANALAQAVTDGATSPTIYIKPGTYPDPFTIPNIGATLLGLTIPYPAGTPAVVISGAIGEATSAGFSMQNITISSAITVKSGGSFYGCFFSNSTSSITNTVNSGLYFYNCYLVGNVTSYHTNTYFLNATFQNCFINSLITTKSGAGDSFSFLDCTFGNTGSIVNDNSLGGESLYVYNCTVGSSVWLDESGASGSGSFSTLVINGLNVTGNGCTVFNLKPAPTWNNISNVTISASAVSLIVDTGSGGSTLTINNCIVTSSTSLSLGNNDVITFNNSNFNGSVTAGTNSSISFFDGYVTTSSNSLGSGSAINLYGTANAAGSFVGNTVNLNSAATDGFLYVPTCNGTPTGTPTVQGSAIPIVIDNTTGISYKYYSGAWITL